MNVRTKQPAQSVVEMTLVLPLLLFLLLGMVDFSLAYNRNVILRNAVAEGGYFAAQNPGNEAGVRSQILQDLSDLQPAVTNSDITITACVASTNGPETMIEIGYDHPMLFGMFGAGSSIRLTNSTVVPQFGGC